ncbi:MalY/PatB family protein [Canibacter zhoujuaniae]|uniref:MalY/PatB family protein n=1 Tax=Canibacter zhoujuaniae TaxID=2708343 RepID=UPI001420C95E|nr:aminotransferase class I/II-fold pyridoxal phosphate-dependent enzyme [Canibacter zhoujuaniae]
MSNGGQVSYPNSNAPEPSGTAWDELTSPLLHTRYDNAKYQMVDSDVLPFWIAEMDFPPAQEIRDAWTDAIASGSIGYVHESLRLREGFAAFAKRRWGWDLKLEQMHATRDVYQAVRDALHLFLPENGGHIALHTPNYNGFAVMFSALPQAKVSQLELQQTIAISDGRQTISVDIDYAALEEYFRTASVDVFVLCNPHNPFGRVWSAAELERLAQLCAKYRVAVVSDEIHAPLTHRDATFIPFAPIAAKHGVPCFVTTSASKSWNIPGTKCALLIAAGTAETAILADFPTPINAGFDRFGYLGNLAAFTAGEAWLERAIERIEANQILLRETLDPAIPVSTPNASYLAWLDLRNLGLGDSPTQTLLSQQRIKLADGDVYGRGGQGFARFNVGCAPEMVIEGARRINTAIGRN